MKNPFLIGNSVYLRPLEREDARLFVRWLNDAEVSRTLMKYLPINVRAEEQFIEKLYQNDHEIVLGIVVKETDRLIGGTGFKDINTKDRHAGFGLVIGEKTEWGKGYGTEATVLLVKYAFDALNLNRVWLHVYEDNVRGQRAYEKAGFKREGVLRQESYRDGRYWDTIAMAVLRQEWDAAKLARA